jgi:hypothetical protein
VRWNNSLRKQWASYWPESLQIGRLTVSLFADYRLNAKNVIHAVRGLRSLINGFIAIEAVGSFRLNVDLTESYTRSIECPGGAKE